MRYEVVRGPGDGKHIETDRPVRYYDAIVVRDAQDEELVELYGVCIPDTPPDPGQRLFPVHRYRAWSDLLLYVGHVGGKP